jgi:exodeoxyribonuclease-5
MISSPPDLFKTIDQSPVLVPNARLAEAWIGQYYRFLELAAGVFIEPRVRTLSEWSEALLIESCVLAGEEFPATANHQQQLELWEAAIATDEEIADPNQVVALARLAHSAERQLRQWDVFVAEAAANDQFRKFLRWRGRFYAAMAERGFATAEQQIVALTKRLSDPGLFTLPVKLTLFGFLELTRIEEALLRQLGLNGVEIIQLPLEGLHKTSTGTLHRFTDFAAELTAAAQFAGDSLEQGAEQVALVINDIERVGNQVKHVLERYFHPDQIAADSDISAALFHIPSGESLAAQQVVAEALMLLDLSLSSPQRRWPAAKMSRFLLSPYTHGSTQEHLARAGLELHMRRTQTFELSLADIGRWLQMNQHKSQAPVLEQLLSGLGSAGSDLSPAEQMMACLKYWGWGESVQHSPQIRRCVQRVLKQIEKLAFLQPQNSADALRLLKTLCRDSRIITHGGELSAIQVLSPEAAIGRRFDAVRVLNMRQDNWPAKPVQNGLIPPVTWPLLSRATIEDQFEHARRVTALLKTLASEISFSWTDSENGVEVSPSALLVDLGVPVATEIEPAGFWQRALAPRPDMLEERVQEPGLPLDPAANAHLPGGSGLFADQAAAPMAAYCRRRLGAQWWEMPGPFVDAAFRGQVIHKALEILYSGMVETALLPDNAQIPAAIAAALDQYRARQKMTAAAYSAEKIRLQLLLAEWLQLDQQRPEFVPLSLECRESIQLQGFEISMRIDRIDVLEDGRLLLIDYKSGNTQTNGWCDDRLSNPQLPLYAMLFEQHGGQAVSGVSFAGVRLNGCTYEGIGADPLTPFDCFRVFGTSSLGLVKKFASWDDMRAQWHAQLQVLFDEIRQGHCENRVYDAGGVKYFGLEPLLRIAEGEQWLAEHGND